MPEEAFALSPISARPSLPSEADYDAIREAFMETARGRWFLSEYAKRNRNADTRMVLDAVERIEQNLTAQKQSASSGLVDALGAISALISETKTIVAEAMPDPAETLAAARDGARVTREVATALRQCGADVRICDLLEAQVDAIDDGHRQLTLIAPRHAVLAAFDRLLQGVVDLASGPATATEPAKPRPSRRGPKPRRQSRRPALRRLSPRPSPRPRLPTSTLNLPSRAKRRWSRRRRRSTRPSRSRPSRTTSSWKTAIAPFASATSERAPFETDAAVAPVEPSTPTLEQIVADEAALDAEAAYDISVLDMVAQEMSALDDDMAEFDLPEPSAAEPLAVAPVSVDVGATARRSDGGGRSGSRPIRFRRRRRHFRRADRRNADPCRRWRPPPRRSQHRDQQACRRPGCASAARPPPRPRWAPRCWRTAWCASRS